MGHGRSHYPIVVGQGGGAASRRRGGARCRLSNGEFDGSLEEGVGRSAEHDIIFGD